MPTPDQATVFEQFRSALTLIAAGDDRAAAAVLEDVKRQAKGSAALPLDTDLPLWGAKQIGVVIGVNQRKAFHLLEAGQLPAKKIGKIWVSTKRRLLQRVLGDEDSWVQPPPKPEPSSPPTHVPRSRKRKLRRKAT